MTGQIHTHAATATDNHRHDKVMHAYAYVLIPIYHYIFVSKIKKRTRRAQIFSTRKAFVKTEIQNGRAGERKPEGGGGGEEMADSVTNYLKDAYTNSVRPHTLVASGLIH